MKRVSISKKTRFEVFKRDKFQCQYCGVSAPDVLLEVDHINPVANGGDNNLLNLITSCFDCNRGKLDREISDNSEIQKQKKQLDQLQERKSQIEMLCNWRSGLLNLQSDLVENVSEQINDLISPYSVSESYKTEIKLLLKKYGYESLCEGIDKAESQYLHKDGVDRFLDMIPKICYWQDWDKKNPEKSELKRLANYSRKSWRSGNPNSTYMKLLSLFDSGLTISQLSDSIHGTKNYYEFERNISTLMEELNG